MSEEKRPEWMTSVSALVNTEDYLLGRKIDKTFELGKQERIERAKRAREELIASDRIKLAGDPALEIAKRKHELKMELINNPILLKQFRERLLREDREKNEESTPNDTNSTVDAPKPSSSKTSDRDNRSSDRKRDHDDHHHRDRRRRSRSKSTSSDSSSSSDSRKHRSRDRHHRQRDERRRSDHKSRRKGDHGDRRRRHHHGSHRRRD